MTDRMRSLYDRVSPFLTPRDRVTFGSLLESMEAAIDKEVLHNEEYYGREAMRFLALRGLARFWQGGGLAGAR